MRKVIFGIRYLKHKLFSGFYHLGWKVAFADNVTMTNPNFISLGDYVSLDSNCEIAVIRSHLNYVYDNSKPVLQLEEGVGISRDTDIFAVKKIQIKKNVMIGPHCFISDYDHNYEDVNKPVAHQPLRNIQPVIIEEGVWVGTHVTICSGVTIGKNSVIGAGSVVTKSIPSFSLAVGVPAKVVKTFNFTLKRWERV